MKDELEQLIGCNEQILYKGKPDFKCFIFESIFNRMLWFSLLWLIFDLHALNDFLSGGLGKESFYIIPFFLFHLMPVWMYLGGILFSVIKHKNTTYIVTNAAIYASGGIFERTFNTKSFAEMSHVNLHRSIFDQMFKVGDVIITSNQLSANNYNASICINSISDYIEVYEMIKRLQTNVYTDIMYPNDLRPDENHGYDTNYKK